MPSRIYSHHNRDKTRQKRAKNAPKIDRDLLLRLLELDSGEKLTDLRQWEELPPPFPFEWDNERQEYITF
jgi:hypothetical protein